MRTISFGIAAALTLTGAAQAQSNAMPDGDGAGIRAAMVRMVALSDAHQLRSPAGRDLFAGELASVDRESIGAIPQPDRIVALSGGQGVARLPGDAGRPDGYFHLRFADGGWRIVAVRTFGLPVFVHQLRDNLRAMNRRTAELEAHLANLELTFATDARLADWFAAHRAELETLRALGATAEGRALARALHLNDVGLRVEPSGLLNVSIGGIIDNSVGFLHAADPALVPPIDPSDHIWIEPLGDGWYLYRTT